MATGRPGWDDVWTGVAVLLAARSTCPRSPVGAVVVTPANQLVATGYNGAPRGAPHCTDVGCAVDATGSCRRAVHAEANALVQAGRLADGATLYTTRAPCPSCAALVVNAGVRRVVYRDPYRQVEGAPDPLRTLGAAGVRVDRVGGTGPRTGDAR